MKPSNYRRSLLVDTIIDELVERDWRLSDVARRMGDNAGRDLLALQMLFACDAMEKSIVLGRSMAEGLGRAFDVSPELFLNLAGEGDQLELPEEQQRGES